MMPLEHFERINNFTFEVRKKVVTQFFAKFDLYQFSLKDTVEEELIKLTEENIITPLNFAQWTTPIVSVLNKNGQIRICDNFKVTLNPKLCIEWQPLPKFEDLMGHLSN